MSSKCPCQCGQATAETTRMRLVECGSCGMTARLTRKQLAAGGMLCGHCHKERGAIEPMIPRCLYDRALTGDEVAERVVSHLAQVAYSRSRGIKGSRPTRHRTQARCANIGCGRFMPDGATQCPSCNFDPARGYADAMPF